MILTDEQIDAFLGVGSAGHFHKNLWRSLFEDGIRARAAKMPLNKCPPFLDGDMAIYWKIGWHDEDQRRIQRKVRALLDNRNKP